MKRLVFIMLSAVLFTGCFADEEEPSALDYASLESNQTHHLRPIHQLHDDWSAQRLGRTLTIRSNEPSIRLSVRRNPNRVIIRQNGSIVGSVESQDGVVRVVSVQKSQAQSDNQTQPVVSQTAAPEASVKVVPDVPFLENARNVMISKPHPEISAGTAKNVMMPDDGTIALRCVNDNTAEISWGGGVQRISVLADRVSSERLTVSQPEKTRRVAIYDTLSYIADPNQSQGCDLESPFNLLGTLIFHEDRMPLASRAAIAWFVTVFGFSCVTV